jgi:hypothetical protein
VFVIVIAKTQVWGETYLTIEFWGQQECPKKEERTIKCLHMDIRMKVKRFIKVRKNGIHNDDTNRFYVVGSKNFQSEAYTNKEFLNCKNRLLHVNAWSRIAGLHNTTFSLCGSDGKPLTSVYPVEGDFIRIAFSELFSVFWMRIDHVMEGNDFTEVITTPAHDPTGKENKTSLSRLSGAHSIFRIEKVDNSVYAVVINIIDGGGGHAFTEQSLRDWDMFLTRPWKSLAEYVVGSA